MRSFLFFLFTGLTALLSAQATFHITYSYQGDEAGLCVMPVGNSCIVGGTSDDGNTNYGFLVYITPMGDTQWTRHVGAPFTQVRSICTAGSDFVIAGEGLAKMNATTGNLVWAKAGPGDFREVRLYSGGYYAAGNEPVNGGMIVWKTDVNGDTIWTRRILAPGQPHCESMAVTAGQEPVLAASSDSGIMIVKLSYLGQPQFNQRYHFPDASPFMQPTVGRIISTSFSDLIVVGTYQDTAGHMKGYMLRTHGDGSMPSLKTYYDPTGNTLTYFSDVTEEPSTFALLLSGTAEANFNGAFCQYLVRADAQGDTVWTCGYRVGDAWGARRTTVGNGDYVLCGYNAQMDMYVVRTDPTGDAQCNMEHFSRTVAYAAVNMDSMIVTVVPSGIFSSVSPVVFSGCTPQTICTTAIGMEEETGPAPLTVFPNPSNGTFTLERQLLSATTATIAVLDVTGRVVLETQRSFSAGEARAEMTLALPAGTYFLRLVSEEETAVARIVVQ